MELETSQKKRHAERHQDGKHSQEMALNRRKGRLQLGFPRRHGLTRSDTSLALDPLDDSRQAARDGSHDLSVGRLQSWLEGGGKSPNEQVAKSRLKKILQK